MSSACLLFLRTSPSCVHSLHAEIFVLRYCLIAVACDCCTHSFACVVVRSTCLLSASPGRWTARSVSGRVKRGHADHIGGVTGQVLQLHPSFRHEQSPQPLCLILTLELPEVNLHGIRVINKCKCLHMLLREYSYFCFHKTPISNPLKGKKLHFIPCNVFLSVH